MRPSPPLLLLPLLLLTRPLTWAERVQLEVVTHSSPCSATCGLGVKNQTLCSVSDLQTALDEATASGSHRQVTGPCRQRAVTCRETWRCGLRTLTVMAGRRLEADCLSEVMAAVGRFSWRVSWRYARGIISSDDSLFARWEAPQLERLILDPAREEHAGTYRCDVQDAALRRVKTVYWGVRVLPAGIVNLDYDQAGAQRDSGSRAEEERTQLPLPHLVLSSLAVALTLAALVLLALLWTSTRRTRHLENHQDL